VAVFRVARAAFCLLGRWPRRVFVYLFGDAETTVSETRWIRGGLESFYSQTDDVLHFDVGAKHLIFCEKILLSCQSKNLLKCILNMQNKKFLAGSSNSFSVEVCKNFKSMQLRILVSFSQFALLDD